MDNTQARALINDFLAVYGWLYRYVNRTWWRWDVDTECWEYVDARHFMRQAFAGLAEDLFPQIRKLWGQVQQDYVFTVLLRELRFPLTAANLPSRPTPGSRHSSAAPAPVTRPVPGQPSEPGHHRAVPSLESDHQAGTGGSAGHTP